MKDWREFSIRDEFEAREYAWAAAARASGVTLGRPRALDAQTVREAHHYHAEQFYPGPYLAFLLGVSRHTLARAFRREGLPYPISLKTTGGENEKHV